MELWRTDGTIDGTRLFADIEDGPLSSFPGEFAVHRGQLHLAATTSDAGREIWRMDDNVLTRVTDTLPGSASAYGYLLGSYADELYFIGDDGITGEELWIVDDDDNAGVGIHHGVTVDTKLVMRSR